MKTEEKQHNYMLAKGRSWQSYEEASESIRSELSRNSGKNFSDSTDYEHLTEIYEHTPSEIPPHYTKIGEHTEKIIMQKSAAKDSS